MPGLAPGIRVFASITKDVDGRTKSGHDGCPTQPLLAELRSIHNDLRCHVTVIKQS